MKTLIAAATAGLLLATVVVWSPDGEVSVFIENAQAQSEAPDSGVALLLSLLVPGLLQLAYTDEAQAGLVFLLIAIVGASLISYVMFGVLRFGLGSLLALLFWVAIGYYAWTQAEPKMYGSRIDATVPIAMEPRILYNGVAVH